MNQPKSVLSIFVWIVLLGISGVVTVGWAAPKQSDPTNASYGRIHFNNDKGEEKCTLPIPEENQTWDFGSPKEICENNMVSTFWLENVPSATLIYFHEDRTCSDAEGSGNFYFKLRTVKQPTDWAPGGSVLYSIDALRNIKDGQLIPKKNVRIEKAFVGSYFHNKNLNERLSCVYIERSQPVN